MAWNSKSGSLNPSSISDDEYWSLFNFVFSESCHKTSTYKFALLKSILDNLLNNTPDENGQLIFYSDLFAKFAECFWNLVVKYHLHQQKPTGEGKTSKIEQIFNEATAKNPLLENLEFASIEENTKSKLIQKVQAECRKYVLGALYGDFGGKLYGFDQNGNFITLSQSAYEFLLKYKIELEKLNYYAWAKFLEKINEENVLFHLLSKLELSLPERTPLEIYRNILFSEFEECNCFYCGKKLGAKIHVDHFIPWSFVKEDKLWNFVLSCPECNIKKSNILPPQNTIARILKRNRIILNASDDRNNSKINLAAKSEKFCQTRKIAETNSTFIKAHFKNYNENLIPRLWQYAKFSGFRIMQTTYFSQPDFGNLKVAEP